MCCTTVVRTHFLLVFRERCTQYFRLISLATVFITSFFLKSEVNFKCAATRNLKRCWFAFPLTVYPC